MELTAGALWSKVFSFAQTSKTRKTAYLIVAGLFLLISSHTNGQANTYSFSAIGNQSLTPLTAPVTLIAKDIDDGVSAITNLPFTFNYGGTDYTQFSVSSNGLLGFGPSIVTNTSSNSMNSLGTAIAPFWDDLLTNSQNGYTGVQYQVFGSAPNRTIVVQWTAYNYNSASNIQFQSILTEGSNLIQFVYGAGVGGNGSIGIARGSNNFISVTVTSKTSSTSVADNNVAFPAATTLFTFTPPPACTGTPSAGTTVSSVSSVCPNTAFSLSISGATVEKNITYQWQSSIDGVSYTTISGATSSSLNRAQTEATYYRCLLTCTNSNQSAASTPVLVGIKTTTECLCIPTYNNYGYAGVYLSNVSTIGGVSNVGNNSSFSVYSNFSSGPSQYKGQEITFSFTSANGAMVYAVWIDFNDNSIFEAGEKVITNNNTTNVTNGVTSDFIVPSTAPAGTHKMRIRADLSGYGISDPCNPLYYGETEDYLFTVLTPVACTGTPTPGNTLSDVTTVCPTTSFTLRLQNNTNQSGILYQWQSSSDGINFTNISGATALKYTGTQSAARYYRCVVTCSNSGISSTSTALRIDMSPLANCYCIPPVSNNVSSTYYISNVSTKEGVSNFSNSSYKAPTSYTNYLGVGASQYQGQPITFSLSSVGQSQSYAVWIDYNDNGAFEASERIFFTNNNDNKLTVTTSYTIPSTAPAGTHRMRVRSEPYGWTPPSDACSILQYGETEDYGFTVLAAPACTGTPNPGNTLTNGTNPICAGTSFTLSLQNNFSQSGITYQWQKSIDGSSFTDIVGATNSTHTASQSEATYYRCAVICGSLTGYSTPLNIALNNPLNCYCIPDTSIEACSSGYINNITSIGGVANFSNTSTCSPSTYSDFMSSYTVSQYQGQNVTLRAASFMNAYEYAIWVDYNDNGLFESTERVAINANASNSLTGVLLTFTVPSDAPAGIHRLRIRGDWSMPSNACATLSRGETEDYALMVIAPPPACTGTPVPGNTLTSGANPVCAGSSFALSLQNSFVQSGITYQWQSSPNGSTWSNIAGATAPTYTTSQNTATYYRCVVSCTSSGLSGNSTALNVTMNTLTNCYCVPEPNNLSGSYISNVTISGGIGNFNNSSVESATSYSNFATTVASQYRGRAITISVANTYGYSNGIWIDYNDNGEFETTEKISGTPSSSSITYTVPVNAPAGTHRMRVKVDETGTIDPCASSYYSETEDYSFTVLVPPACAATPAPGATTLVFGSSPICPGTEFTLSIQNNTPQSGLTYQWQSSVNGTIWTDIIGATAITYTATQNSNTYYRCVVTCSNSSMSNNSTALQVTMNPIGNCYCVPTTSSNACTGGFLMNVGTSNGITNFTNTTGCTFVSYANYSATHAASQYQGSPVTVSFFFICFCLTLCCMD